MTLVTDFGRANSVIAQASKRATHVTKGKVQMHSTLAVTSPVAWHACTFIQARHVDRQLICLSATLCSFAALFWSVTQNKASSCVRFNTLISATTEAATGSAFFRRPCSNFYFFQLKIDQSADQTVKQRRWCRALWYSTQNNQPDLNSTHKTKERTTLCGTAMSDENMVWRYHAPYLIYL